MYKKDSLKHTNNYLMDEINDNWSADKGFSEEMYNKIISLLHANFSLIESIDKILLAYQDKVDENLKTDL